MFGHQDDPAQQQNTPFNPAEPQHDGVLGGDSPAFTPSAPLDTSTSDSPADYVATDADGQPSADAEPALPPPPPIGLPPVGTPDPLTDDEDDTEEPVLTPAAPSPVADNNLLDLKQNALHQLSPLLNHLEQSPEEKFRTTMMMIQASDNQDLLQTAYEAAQAITDEKAKAQALLDIVNEINYFTQQHTS